MEERTFAAVYAQLNEQQKRAVDTVYGPVLVLAGPGTGKTQLLSARVAHILRSTDAQPHNILCLTFTENGAANMRERLARFIGRHAYDVQISTYHSFGSTIIGRFPEYFTELRLERPIDELGKHQILAEIIARLDYSSPLKQVRYHIGDLVSTISEIKRGLFSPDELRAVALDVSSTIERTQPILQQTLAPYAARMPSKLAVAEPLFRTILDDLTGISTVGSSVKAPAYATLAARNLEVALEAASDSGSTKPLTAWKNNWLAKNTNNHFTLAGSLEALRVSALADVLEAYQAELQLRGLYDFDDMIIRVTEVLGQNDALRFTLQEQFQFVLLDEFQDTNAAQLRLVQLLTDNPVHEGMPNVLAVGDDDQAIYAFQGAEVSNMLDFYHSYRDVQVVSLSENYRSRTEILETASNIARQIESRLHTHFPGVEKLLRATNIALPPVSLERTSYESAPSEYSAVAQEIAQLISEGTPAEEIAVLAPKHKHLEPLVPYLQKHGVAVSYEKRENVLEAPVVRELLTMSKLVLALHHGQQAVANSLWPEVLSYNFWGFSTADIWKLAWQASDQRKPWAELLLDAPMFRHAALLLLTLAGKVETASLETILDTLIGSTDIATRDPHLPSVRSPLRDYYIRQNGDQVLYETVSQLAVLRAKLREHQLGQKQLLQLADLLEFAQAYEAAGQQMLNTNPHSQSPHAVQLMTVYKAKGLEFSHVFLPACDNGVWGSKASGMSNKLTLPANLAHIRHSGSTDDERLRVLYVALTRAKHGLHLSNHRQTYAGKTTEAVKYFDEVTENHQSYSRVLPQSYQRVVREEATAPALETLTLFWQERHRPTTAPLRELLSERLANYQLSPTHLTHYIDLKYGGPESFLLGTLLRFPTAPSLEASFGTVIHETLQWLQNQLNSTGELPDSLKAIAHATRCFERELLSEADRQLQIAHAAQAISAYLKSPIPQWRRGNIAEQSFRDENVFVGKVHLGGKIDLLELDTQAKKIVVVDYKTGQLGNDPLKLYKYTLQLYCYKLLVEGSRTYHDYTVEQGKLVFVEPTLHGEVQEKIISFKPQETERVRQLLSAFWQCVQTLQTPDTSAYGDSLKDVHAFEANLIETFSQI